VDLRAQGEVTKAVLSYFVRFPGAADNLEGITRWRLQEERVHRTLEETRVALDWLTAVGYLIREDSLSVEPLFRLNDARRDEAVALVLSDGKST